MPSAPAPLSARAAAHLALTVILFGTGCASVTPHRFDTGQDPSQPKLIYVVPFSAPAANIRADREGEALAAFQQDIVTTLSEELAAQINNNLVPTEFIADPRDLPPSDAWVIVGRFNRVEQGSRALRATLGFGFGGTKLVTTSTVYDLAPATPKPILTIRTTGGSNAPPGAAANLAGFVALGPGGVAGLTIATGAQAILGVGRLAIGTSIGIFPGLTADIRRTAREITATLSEYSHEKGWIPEEQTMRAKRTSEGQIRLNDPTRPGITTPEPVLPATGRVPSSRRVSSN